MAYNISTANFTGGGSNNNNSSSLSLSYLDQRYLEVSGGDKMLTSLNAGNNNLINVIDPVNKQDAATKNYVDSADNLRLKLDGTTSMTGNLNMNNKNIINLAEPKTNNQAVTKNYVDSKIQLLETKIPTPLKNTESLPIKNKNKIEQLITYNHISIIYKPRVWITSQFPYGLLSETNEFGLSDIMQNKVGSFLGAQTTIQVQKIRLDTVSGIPSFILYVKDNIPSKIQINIEFKLKYTFIFIVGKRDKNDSKPIFTSSIPNRLFGWKDNDKIFQVGSKQYRLPGALNDTNLHLFIIQNNNGTCFFSDYDITLNDNGSFTVTEDFGKVIIGNGIGYFCELMLFDTALSDDAIKTLIMLFNIYYKFKEVPRRIPRAVDVVDPSLLQNLT